MPVVRNRELQLRADAVGAGDEHGLPVAVERRLEQRAEAAEPGDDALARGAVRDRADPRDQIVAAIGVDAGIAVAQAGLRRAVHEARDGT